MTINRFAIGRAAIGLILAVSVAACGLPRSGPYYEDIAGSPGEAPVDRGFDLVPVTHDVIGIANLDESRGFEMNLINASPELTAVLGIGDVLQVTIWERGENGLFSPIGGATSLVAEVEERGTIYLPYVGNVRASGRTADGLRRAIVKLLSEKTLDPQVEVKRETGDSKSIIITGTAGVAGIVPIDQIGRAHV